MLNAYLSAVELLLHDPNNQFFSAATLTTFINSARQQVATEGECVRGVATLNTVSGQNVYQHSGIVAPTTPIGIDKLLNPRTISFPNATNAGQLQLEKRPWDWFNFYFLSLSPPPPGQPRAWAPFDPGKLGSFYLAPTPTSIIALSLDGVWLPINLVIDANAEAIPFPWTDAVPFYAAYLAFLDSQRANDANGMFTLYENYMQRARSGVTGTPVLDASPGSAASRTSPGSAPRVESGQR